jgi:photosystem II stability/assembly factor-like uncharacterized protein
MAKAKFVSNKNGAVFGQPNGAANPLYYLGCHEVGEVPIAHPDVDFGYCVDENGAFVEEQELLSPPPTQTTTITTLVGKERVFLEKMLCPPDLYVLQRSCGKRNSVYSPDRVTHLPRARIITDTLQNPVSTTDPNKSMKAFAVKYSNPHIVMAAFGSRKTTAEATNGHDVAAWKDPRCTDVCGKYRDADAYAAFGASGGAGASANVNLSTDAGTTWTAAAADPFAVGAAKNVISLVYVTLPNGTRRLIAAKTAEAGVQGVVAYTDNAGVAWTTVNIGGAAAGHGATVEGGLYAIDNYVWLASALGYIYRSTDYGVSWAVQEGGTIFATSYAQIKFLNKNYGMAVTTVGNSVVTFNGGVNWAACTAFAAAQNNISVEVPQENMAIVGNNLGALYITYDAGTTWEQILWDLSGAGSIVNLRRAPENDHCLWMVHNTAGPVGTVWRSWNGGATWDQLNVITNNGLYGLDVINSETAYVAGFIVGAGTAAIIKYTEKYPPV